MKTKEKFWIVIFSVALLLSSMSQACWASKAFVTDSFRISLRRGPSIENKILRFVPSGLPVEVLETQDGWNRVRLSESEGRIVEGWVLSRYLIRRLPWEEQAKNLLKENAALKEKLASIDNNWGEKVHKEKEMAGELKVKYETVRKANQRLAEENETLRSSKKKKWFTAGGGVLLSGLIVGLLVGKPQRKRKLSYR